MSSLPQLSSVYYWDNFADTREKRNEIFHRLSKLDKQELFDAWEVNNKQRWEDLILSCLNSLSSQNFISISSSSLLFYIHNHLELEIKNYGIG